MIGETDLRNMQEILNKQFYFSPSQSLLGKAIILFNLIYFYFCLNNKIKLVNLYKRIHKILNRHLITCKYFLLFAYLAGKNVRIGGMPYQVRQIPDDKRRNKFVKYSFWTPIGDEGFYNQ